MTDENSLSLNFQCMWAFKEFFEDHLAARAHQVILRTYNSFYKMSEEEDQSIEKKNLKET